MMKVRNQPKLRRVPTYYIRPLLCILHECPLLYIYIYLVLLYGSPLCTTWMPTHQFTILVSLPLYTIYKYTPPPHALVSVNGKVDYPCTFVIHGLSTFPLMETSACALFCIILWCPSSLFSCLFLNLLPQRMFVSKPTEYFVLLFNFVFIFITWRYPRQTIGDAGSFYVIKKR